MKAQRRTILAVLIAVVGLGVTGCGETEAEERAKAKSDLPRFEREDPCNKAWYKPLACQQQKEGEQLHNEAQKVKEEQEQQAP